MERKWVTLEKPPKKPYSERPIFIYFVQCQMTKMVKIGYARDPLARLSSMQTGSPTPLKMLTIIPGDRFKEKQMHARFKNCYSHGEWFSPSPELMAYIDELRGPTPAYAQSAS